MSEQAAATATPPQPKGFAKRESPTETRIEALRAHGTPAFVGYMPYGFPTPEGSLKAMRAMVDNGVDIVEIGLPYSDPMMDGPVIQEACTMALHAGEKMSGVFDAVETVAKAGGVPLIMGYWNLIYHYGVLRFARDFAAAGGAGLVTADLIPDEAGEWFEASDRYGLDRIFLVSPETTDERLALVSRSTRGFVYATARMGVTGERNELDRTPETLVQRTRRAGARNVCVGIGVSTPQQGRQIGAYADGVIVGSALVHAVLDDPTLGKLATTVSNLADGIHNARR